MPDLSSYIRTMLQRGYSINDIRNTLLRSGYPAQFVDQTIYSLNRHEVTHTHHVSPTFFVMIIVILLGLTGTAYFIFREKTPQNLLDVKIKTLSGQVDAGKSLSAIVDLSNLGSADRQDVNMKYELFDSKGSRTTFKSETVALQTTTSQSVSLDIPEDAASGKYNFIVTARIGAETATAEQSVTVKGAPVQTATCSDSIRNQGEEKVDCGGPCKPCEAVQTTVEQVCGDNVCSGDEDSNTCIQDCPVYVNAWDQLDQAKQLADSDPGAARAQCNSLPSTQRDQCIEYLAETTNEVSLCDTIEDQYTKDKCFSAIAKSTKQSAICENIQKESRRDNCYVNFAVDGDYSVCDKIVNQYLSDSCKTLKQAS